MRKQKADLLLEYLGASSLLLFPVMMMLAFAMHFKDLADFFVFELKYVPNSTESFMATLSGPNKNRLFVIPHIVGYMGMPFMAATGMYLGKILYPKKPLLAIIGSSMTVTGVFFLSGVFAAWLSFAAVGNVPVASTENAITVLRELTKMQGPLLLMTTLSVLSISGLIILGTGLLISRIIPTWSAALFLLGNIFIITFMDLDNWMFIGALLILIAMLPVSIKIYKNQR